MTEPIALIPSERFTSLCGRLLGIAADLELVASELCDHIRAARIEPPAEPLPTAEEILEAQLECEAAQERLADLTARAGDAVPFAAGPATSHPSPPVNRQPPVKRLPNTFANRQRQHHLAKVAAPIAPQPKRRPLTAASPSADTFLTDPAIPNAAPIDLHRTMGPVVQH